MEPEAVTIRYTADEGTETITRTNLLHAILKAQQLQQEQIKALRAEIRGQKRPIDLISGTSTTPRRQGTPAPTAASASAARCTGCCRAGRRSGCVGL